MLQKKLAATSDGFSCLFPLKTLFSTLQQSRKRYETSCLAYRSTWMQNSHKTCASCKTKLTEHGPCPVHLLTDREQGIISWGMMASAEGCTLVPYDDRLVFSFNRTELHFSATFWEVCHKPSSFMDPPTHTALRSGEICLLEEKVAETAAATQQLEDQVRRGDQEYLLVVDGEGGLQFFFLLSHSNLSLFLSRTTKGRLIQVSMNLEQTLASSHPCNKNNLRYLLIMSWDPQSSITHYYLSTKDLQRDGVGCLLKRPNAIASIFNGKIIFQTLAISLVCD